MAAIVLEELLAAAKSDSCSFEVRFSIKLRITLAHLMAMLGTAYIPVGVLRHLLSRQQLEGPADGSCAQALCGSICPGTLCCCLVAQVAAVVSQPGKPKGRGNKAVPVPSPVEQLARQHLPDSAILCPKSAKEV